LRDTRSRDRRRAARATGGGEGRAGAGHGDRSAGAARARRGAGGACVGGGAIGWGVASLDVGSTVRGCELPGVREHALATRPIRTLVDRVGDCVEQAAKAAAGTVRVLVV